MLRDWLRPAKREALAAQHRTQHLEPFNRWCVVVGNSLAPVAAVTALTGHPRAGAMVFALANATLFAGHAVEGNIPRAVRDLFRHPILVRARGCCRRRRDAKELTHTACAAKGGRCRHASKVTGHPVRTRPARVNDESLLGELRRVADLVAGRTVYSRRPASRRNQARSARPTSAGRGDQHLIPSRAGLTALFLARTALLGG
jgi:hypothetical protein